MIDSHTDSSGTTEFEFEAIGTWWKIVIRGLQDSDQKNLAQKKAKLKQEIDSFIAEYDLAYSRFKPDSLITKIAQESTKPSTKTYSLPKHSEPLFTLYQDLFELTGGLFTACIGHALEQAGYDSQYSLNPQPTIDTPPSFEVVQFVPALTTAENDLPKLLIPECTSPLVLDFGAAGKGYLVDLIGTIISKHFSGSSWFINAGGDILHHSEIADESMTIGLENPLNTQQVIGTAVLHNKSICGSAGNRRRWSTFHHIINPQTRTSPNHILATWVVADTGLVADGLATALYFALPQNLQTKFDFEYTILYTDGTVHRSDGFTGELFI